MSKYQDILVKALRAHDVEEVNSLLRKTNLSSLRDYDFVELSRVADETGHVEALQKIVDKTDSRGLKQILWDTAFYTACAFDQANIVRHTLPNIGLAGHFYSFSHACKRNSASVVAVLAPLVGKRMITRAICEIVKNNTFDRQVLEELYKNCDEKDVNKVLKSQKLKPFPEGRAFVKERLKVGEDKRSLLIALHETKKEKQAVQKNQENQENTTRKPTKKKM